MAELQKNLQVYNPIYLSEIKALTEWREFFKRIIPTYSGRFTIDFEKKKKKEKINRRDYIRTL